MADYSIDTYLNRDGNYNMYGMTEDMVNRSYGDIVPQAMSNNLPYQAGTLVDAPLASGMIPPWVLAAGSIGYLGGKYDVFGKAKDAVGNWIDGFRGTEGVLSGPTEKHAQTIADLVSARTEDKAMDQGLKTALDDRGYPVITEGPYAGKNMVRRGIQDLHGPEAMIQHPVDTTYYPWETYEEDTLRAAIEQKRIDDAFYANNQDDWRRGPLQDGRSITVSDDRTEWQKWTDSFKRDW